MQGTRTKCGYQLAPSTVPRGACTHSSHFGNPPTLLWRWPRLEMGKSGEHGMYNAATLKADASGYGLVRYLATGAARTNAGGRSMSGDARQLLAPLLEPKISRTFLHERYALLWTARPLTIYRFYGTDATATASILGAYWPPARPSLSSRSARLRIGARHFARQYGPEAVLELHGRCSRGQLSSRRPH
jgi:hypothetical protein